MHCVDLGESFQTHIFLQNLASIQPRTSPVKFARSLAMQQPALVQKPRGPLLLQVLAAHAGAARAARPPADLLRGRLRQKLLSFIDIFLIIVTLLVNFDVFRTHIEEHLSKFHETLRMIIFQNVFISRTNSILM